MAVAETFSDIAANGDLWYIARSGATPCWGFAVLDVTTKAQTIYGTVMSVTGDVVDGEPTLLGGFMTTGSEAVFLGSIYEPYHLPASTRAFSWLPAWWRSDGTTTLSYVDTDYATVIADGPSSDGVNATSRAAIVPSYDGGATSFVMLSNVANNVETTTSNEADAAGPSVITALTL